MKHRGHYRETGPEPCYDCECCALWVQALDELRASIRFHVAHELRTTPCDPACLVCGAVDWQGGAA